MHKFIFFYNYLYFCNNIEARKYIKRFYIHLNTGMAVTGHLDLLPSGYISVQTNNFITK